MLSQWAKTKSAIWRRTLLQGILSRTPLKFTYDLWRFFASRKSTLGMSSLSHELNFICCFLSRTSNRYTPTCCCTILLKWFQMSPKIQVQEDHDDLLCIVIQCHSLPPHAAGLLQPLSPTTLICTFKLFHIQLLYLLLSQKQNPMNFAVVYNVKIMLHPISHIVFNSRATNSCKIFQNLVCTLHPSTFFYVY